MELLEKSLTGTEKEVSGTWLSESCVALGGRAVFVFVKDGVIKAFVPSCREEGFESGLRICSGDVMLDGRKVSSYLPDNILELWEAAPESKRLAASKAVSREHAYLKSEPVYKESVINISERRLSHKEVGLHHFFEVLQENSVEDKERNLVLSSVERSLKESCIEKLTPGAQRFVYWMIASRTGIGIAEAAAEVSGTWMKDLSCGDLIFVSFKIGTSNEDTFLIAFSPLTGLKVPGGKVVSEFIRISSYFPKNIEELWDAAPPFPGGS